MAYTAGTYEQQIFNPFGGRGTTNVPTLGSTKPSYAPGTSPTPVVPDPPPHFVPVRESFTTGGGGGEKNDGAAIDKIMMMMLQQQQMFIYLIILLIGVIVFCQLTMSRRDGGMLLAMPLSSPAAHSPSPPS